MTDKEFFFKIVLWEHFDYIKFFTKNCLLSIENLQLDEKNISKIF